MKRFFHKYFDLIATPVAILGSYILIVLLRKYYDPYTPEAAGSFWVSQLYQVIRVMVAWFFSGLAIQFNFMRSIGAYYSDRKKFYLDVETGRDHARISGMHRDWIDAQYNTNSLWRIVLYLSLRLALTWLILHASIAAPMHQSVQ